MDRQSCAWRFFRQLRRPSAPAGGSSLAQSRAILGARHPALGTGDRPTGRYSELSPATADLERTGGGAYATTFGIARQKAIPFGGEHVLRYRLNATYGIYSSVAVRGFNAYGGGFGTTGRVSPGAVSTVTIAGEYSLTRRPVLALDIGFQTVTATQFSGDPGLDAQSRPALVGRDASNLVTIAPALEYSWNQHVGVLAGPWMSLSGRNTSECFGIGAALYLFL